MGYEKTMAFFRLIAVLFIAAGLMIVGYDVISSIAPGATGFKVVALQELWGWINAGTRDGFVAWSGETGGDTAKAVVSTVLSWPAFAIFGLIGVLLGIIFQKRERAYND